MSEQSSSTPFDLSSLLLAAENQLAAVEAPSEPEAPADSAEDEPVFGDSEPDEPEGDKGNSSTPAPEGAEPVRNKGGRPRKDKNPSNPFASRESLEAYITKALAQSEQDVENSLKELRDTKATYKKIIETAMKQNKEVPRSAAEGIGDIDKQMQRLQRDRKATLMGLMKEKKLLTELEAEKEEQVTTIIFHIHRVEDIEEVEITLPDILRAGQVDEEEPPAAETTKEAADADAS